MKTHYLLRKFHRWGALAILVPLGIMIVAGVLLMLKKDLDWIQPPTHSGQGAGEIPRAGFAQLFAAARAVPQAGIRTWQDLARVDVKPDRGVIKFITRDHWEVQVDTRTAEVMQVAVRRSDVIESIHDGSYFAPWVKRYVFLPSGLVLFLLWLSGVYLFFLPYIRKAGKQRRPAVKTSPHPRET